jgi:hypothetical protein
MLGSTILGPCSWQAAIVLRILIAVVKATSFHDLPGETAGSLASKDLSSGPRNQLSSSSGHWRSPSSWWNRGTCRLHCGSPGFWSHVNGILCYFHQAETFGIQLHRQLLREATKPSNMAEPLCLSSHRHWPAVHRGHAWCAPFIYFLRLL